MSKALELMDEIQGRFDDLSFYHNSAGVDLRENKDWQSLRAEVERLEERAKWLEAQVEAAKRMDAEIEARALEKVSAEYPDGIDHFPETLRLEAARTRAEAET